MIRNKAKSAVLWSGLDVLIRQVFGFVISVILARLLLPDDFGTVALLAIFIGVANLFVNAGLGLAIIQRQDVTHEDESTVFWFNLTVAFVMMLGLCASADWIAGFFNKPILVPLTMVLALNIFVSAAGTIHATLLTKRLDFKTQMKIGVSTSIAGGLLAIYMASYGYGIWSLVAQTLASSVLGVSLLWWFSPWRPRIVFSFASFRKLFGFSGWLFMSWLIDVVYQRGYTMLIGKFYGVHDLGIYNRADSTQSLASNLLTDVLSKVGFPLLSAVNNDLDRMRRAIRTAVQTMMLVAAPSMIGLAVLSEPFIEIVFGKQWVAAAPILQVLCFIGLLYPLHVINLNVLQAQGHSNLFFRLELAKKGVGIGLLVLGSFFGIIGIAFARAAASAIALGINGFYTSKFLKYGVSSQIADSGTSIAISLVMGALIFFANGQLTSRGEIGTLELISLIIFGALTYLILNFLFRTDAFLRVLQILKKEVL